MDLYENLLELRAKYAYTQKLDRRRKYGAKKNEDDGGNIHQKPGMYGTLQY
jgi:hypothetical protein